MEIMIKNRSGGMFSLIKMEIRINNRWNNGIVSELIMEVICLNRGGVVDIG